VSWQNWKIPKLVAGKIIELNPTQMQPSAIIQHFQGTMIMGADVCHKVAGISVAAVVGTTDFSFVPWLQSTMD